MKISKEQSKSGRIKKIEELRGKPENWDNFFWKQGYYAYQSDIPWDDEANDDWKEGYIWAHDNFKGGLVPQEKE